MGAAPAPTHGLLFSQAPADGPVDHRFNDRRGDPLAPEAVTALGQSMVRRRRPAACVQGIRVRSSGLNRSVMAYAFFPPEAAALPGIGLPQSPSSNGLIHKLSSHPMHELKKGIKAQERR